MFHLVKQPSYYAAVDEIREGYEPATIGRNKYARPAHTPDAYTDVSRGVLRDMRSAGHQPNPLGKLPGSVWNGPIWDIPIPAVADPGVPPGVGWPHRRMVPHVGGWSRADAGAGPGWVGVVTASGTAIPAG